VTDRAHRVLPPHAVQAVQVWWKSASNEGQFTLEADIFSRPYLAWQCSGVTETEHVAHPTHRLQAVQVWSKSVSNEGQLTREAKEFFLTTSPRIAAR
jgi:hypothetical protein